MPITVMTGKIAFFSAWRKLTAASRRALGAGGADVILPQDFEHRGARDPHRQRGAAKADRHRRNAIDRERLGPGCRVRIEDRHGSEQRDGRHQDQQAEPERRQRQAAQADDAQA
jgi:hypothetical protein